MRRRKILLIILMQVIWVAATAQEYWNGTKSQTSTINRSGQTQLGVLNFRSSGTGTTTVMEHMATTGDLYIRSVASTTNGDVGNLILNDVGGKVGIGTSRPYGTLHLMAGNTSNTPLASIVLSRYWGDSTHTRASAIFHYTDGVKDKLIFSLAGLGGTYNSPLDLAQAKMAIQANGNIGIGTTDPRARLHIAEANVSNAPRAPIVLSRYWLDDNNTRASAIFHYSTGVNEKLVFAVSGLGGTYTTPVDLNQAKMVVQANGNVGIGTTEPKHKLSVNGVVQAKEVNVTTTDWADYVFEDGYRLPDLKEVESQINKNGHLPGMPSAATLEKEGVDLGRMVELQQKKIEELTLYLIEQQKQIAQLSHLTESLQKKLSDEKR